MFGRPITHCEWCHIKLHEYRLVRDWTDVVTMTLCLACATEAQEYLDWITEADELKKEGEL